MNEAVMARYGDNTRIRELEAEVERLRKIRDTQRNDIEWLHERLRQIVLLAQPVLRSDREEP